MKNIILIILFLFSIRQTVYTQNLDSFISKKLIEAYTKNKVPGIYVGVLENSHKKYFSAGFADTNSKKQFAPDMLFEIGSITKTFTAYIVLSVLKEHHISETSAIISFLPDSVRKNNSLQFITFKSLLNHTSGLPRLPNNMNAFVKDPMQPYENYTRENLFSFLKNYELKADGKSNYSNLGFGLLGVLAEIISKKSYKELLEEKIFKPFNLQRNKQTGKKMQGYFDGNAVAFWKWNCLKGCGALILNANSMLSYLQNIAKPINHQSKQMIDSLTSPTISIDDRIKVGRGWHMLQEENGETIYWHNGGTYGFSTFAAFLKNKSAAVIVIINAFNKNDISDDLGIEIMNALSKQVL